MFQNIQRENNFDEEDYLNKKLNGYNSDDSDYENSSNKAKQVLAKLFSLQNIILYFISFMVSMVGFRSENIMLSMSPFAISFISAMVANRKTIGIAYLFTLLGTFISFGPNSLLLYFLTSLLFFVLILIKQPKEEENANEQKRVGFHLGTAVLAVQVIPMFFRTFYFYDLLTSIMLTITSFVFYKIFANSILMISEFKTKKAFAIEEVMGTSLLLAIASMAFGNLNIFGYSLCHIISILIVLVLGWKNGMLVGATGGVTIGVVLGIIGNSDPILIAAYALSGMIAGLFYKLGRIGVISRLYFRKCYSKLCSKWKYCTSNFNSRNINSIIRAFSCAKKI